MDQARALQGDVARYGTSVRRIEVTTKAQAVEVGSVVAISMMAMPALAQVSLSGDASYKKNQPDHCFGRILTTLAHSATLSSLSVELYGANAADVNLIATVIATLEHLAHLDVELAQMCWENSMDAAQHQFMTAVLSRPHLESLALTGIFPLKELPMMSGGHAARLRQLRIFEQSDDQYTDAGGKVQDCRGFLRCMADSLEHLDLHLSWSSFPAWYPDPYTFGPEFTMPRLRYLRLRARTACEIYRFRRCPLQSVHIAACQPSMESRWATIPLDLFYNAHDPPMLEKITMRAKLAESWAGLVEWCKERRLELVLTDKD
ncbi:hypothetical protein JCM10908_002417 [Rhodotorula pacifica]|uniref:uncharacterized protein n=1 Tax=Rhodotorula pacifica TaxID=1495444 RepID=UPI003175A571